MESMEGRVKQGGNYEESWPWLNTSQISPELPEVSTEDLKNGSEIRSLYKNIGELPSGIKSVTDGVLVSPFLLAVIGAGILLSVFLCSLIALVLRIHSRRRRGGKGGLTAPPPTPSWQVTDELEWPTPPSFILPLVSAPPKTQSVSPPPKTQPVQAPPSHPPPPPYLGLPQHTGHGASALTNRPVDYPAHYTSGLTSPVDYPAHYLQPVDYPEHYKRTHQAVPKPLPLASFPSGLALNTASTVSETVHLTDLTQVKRTANLALLPRHSLLPRARLTRPLPLLPSLPKPQMQARFERDYMSLAECKQGESGRVDFKTGHPIANHHG